MLFSSLSRSSYVPPIKFTPSSNKATYSQLRSGKHSGSFQNRGWCNSILTPRCCLDDDNSNEKSEAFQSEERRNKSRSDYMLPLYKPTAFWNLENVITILTDFQQNMLVGIAVLVTSVISQISQPRSWSNIALLKKCIMTAGEMRKTIFLFPGDNHVLLKGGDSSFFRLLPTVSGVILCFILAMTIKRFGIEEFSREKAENESVNKTISAIIASAAFSVNLGSGFLGSSINPEALLVLSMSGSLFSLFWHKKAKFKPALLLSLFLFGFSYYLGGITGVFLPVLIWSVYLFAVGEGQSLIPVVVLFPLLAFQAFSLLKLSGFSLNALLMSLRAHFSHYWLKVLALSIGYFPWSISALYVTFLKLFELVLQKAKSKSQPQSLAVLSFCWLVVGILLNPSCFLAPPLAILSVIGLIEFGSITLTSLFFQLLAGSAFLSPFFFRNGFMFIKQNVLLADFIEANLLQIKGMIILGLAGTYSTRTRECAVFMEDQISGEISEDEEKGEEKPSFLPIWVVHFLSTSLFLFFVIKPLTRV